MAKIQSYYEFGAEIECEVVIKKKLQLKTVFF